MKGNYKTKSVMHLNEEDLIKSNAAVLKWIDASLLFVWEQKKSFKTLKCNNWNI